jgi:hypothetical protein
MAISKLSDKTRLLGASLKNLNPTAIYNKTNEIINTVNYNYATVLATPICDFTVKSYTISYTNKVGTISIGDIITGDSSGAAAEVKEITNNTITFIYKIDTVAFFQSNENISDINTSATATITDYIVYNDQEIILNGSNKFIISNVVLFDPDINVPKIEVSLLKISKDIKGNDEIINASSISLAPTDYYDYNLTTTFSLSNKIIDTNKLYLSVAGIDVANSGTAKLYIYGIVLD